MLFGLAALLLIAVIGLPFLLKDFKASSGQGGVYANVLLPDTMGGRAPITITFSSPMVTEEELNKPVGASKVPFTLTPTVAGDGLWVNPRTFKFTPQKVYAPATRYIIALHSGLKALNGKDVTQKRTFLSMPLTVLGMQQKDWKDDLLEITLSFNLPVAPDVLREFLSIKGNAAGDKSVDYKVLSTAVGEYLVIGIEKPASTQYTLTLSPELLSNVGPEPLGDELSYVLTPKKEVEVVSTSSENVASAPTPVPGALNGPPTLKVYNSEQSVSEDGQCTIYISVSGPMDPEAVKPFLNIKPDKVDKVIWDDDRNALVITGNWKPGENVAITLKKGAPSESGTTLKEDYSHVLVIPEIEPFLRIDNQAQRLVITPAYGLRVPISGVNVKSVEFTLYRLYDNNIPVEMASEYDYVSSFSERFSELCGQMKVDLTEPRNQVFHKAVDLADLVKDKNMRGLYLLRTYGAPVDKQRADNNSDDYYWENYEEPSEQLILITDLAPVAMRDDRSLKVWVNSLSSGKAVANADVIAYSMSNQVVAGGRTDSSGLVTLKPEQSGPWPMRPALIVVKTKDDVSYLNLAGNLFDNAQFDIWGESWSDLPYRAFCFTSRGVYRPGEHVDFKALFRDAELQPPAPAPMLYQVFSPTGRELLRGTGLLSDEGGLVGGFDLPDTAPTGMYSLRVFAPGGEDKPFGYVSFNVEEFVPPRIEVNLTGSAAKIIGDEKLTLDFGADYLFGAPGTKLNYNLDRFSRVQTFSHKDWPDVYFGDDTKFEASTDKPLVESQLDDAGRGNYVYNAAKSDLAAPSMVNWNFVLNVQEDGGRWVSKALQVNYYPRKEQLGLKLPGYGQVEPGKPATLTAVAVDTDGKPLSGVKSLNYTIERIVSHYNYVRQSNGSYRYNYSEELVEAAKGEVALASGSGEFNFTPNKTGTYRVRVLGPNGSAAAARLHVWSPYWTDSEGEGEESRLAVVDVTFDKVEYAVGDTAQVTLRAPVKGRLLFNVESGRTLMTRIMDMDKEEVTISVPVTKDFIPNVYCTAWVVKPVKDEGKWSAHRAYGVAPLKVSKDDNLLKITLDSPDKVLPGGTLPVTVKLARPDGAPSSGEVCLYLVDEAILKLTNYETPDPMSLFWAKRSLEINAVDFYDELTEPESKATPLLKAGGGDDGAATSDYLSAIKRNQIMLTVFVGKVDVPASGQTVVELKLPEFSGKGRLMAVATSGKHLGSAEKFVTIARDIVVETTGPRAVAPGDEFIVPVKAFLSSGVTKPVKGEVKVSVSGPLQLMNKESLKVNMSPTASGGQAGPSGEFKIKAGPNMGLGIVTVESVIPNDPANSYTQTVEIPVRSPFPKTEMSGSGIAKGNTDTKLEIPDAWVPGTGKMTVTAGKGTSANLLPALNYLKDYPYGCLEQTTSKAWPFIIVPELIKESSPELVDQAKIDKALAIAVNRLSFMQLYDGSFAMWPGETQTTLWTSVYATHFLWEARTKTQLPKDMLESALNFLKQIMAVPAGAITPYDFDSILSTKAYAAYVLTLAGQAPVAWLQQLHEDRALLSPSGRVYLAAAMALQQKSSKPLRSLGEMPEVKWGGVNPTLESSVRNQAILLTAWSQVEPGATEAGILAKNIQDLGFRGYWYTTQENAMALLALSKYYAVNPTRDKPFTGALKDADNQSLMDFSSEKDGNAKIASRPGKALPLPVSLSVQGEGSAYYSWSSTGVPKEAPASFAENLKVTLTLKDDAGKELVWDGKNPLRIKQGTRLNAALTIEPSTPVEQLIVVDVLPGGLEVDNPRLQELQDMKPENSPYYWNCRLDLRDERLILIINYLDRPMTYNFTMRAVSKGTFVMPPVAGEGMYAPFIRALSNSGSLMVE